KELINQHTGKWSSKGLGVLLDKVSGKVSLSEAYQIFKEQGLKREAIVSHYASFQNKTHIKSDLDELTKKDYFTEVENTVIFRDDGNSLRHLFYDWRADLEKLYRARHIIVHENNKDYQISPYKAEYNAAMV